LNHLKSLLLRCLFAVGLFGTAAGAVFGQENLPFSTSHDDSVTADLWSEETLYNIEKLRIERWFRENKDTVSDALIEQVVQLLLEARKYAEAGEYYLANVWLDTVWELLEPTAPLDTLEYATDGHLFDSALELSPEQKSSLVWSREVISGVDFWRQKLSFAFSEQDSTLLEGSGNPYSGLRFSLDYSNANSRSFQASTFFKYSQDYFTGDVNLRFRTPMGQHLTWTVENRFEGTSFNHDFDLRYIQNLSILQMRLANLGIFSFDLRDDLLLRRYGDESSTYPNYINNAFYAAMGLHPGMQASLNIAYRNVNRTHGRFPDRDYREHRLEVSWLQYLSKLTVTLDNELKSRDYLNAPGDGVYQDYWENYFRGEVKLNFSSFMGVGMEGTITKRDYRFINQNSLPDYLFWEAEPSLIFHLGSKWNLSTGFMFGQQIHQKLADRLAANVRDTAFNILFEDYEFYGPTFEIEFFEVNGLLFSVRESYVFRRYPHTPVLSAADFLPYADRNINSILLFLTWNVTRRWQFNVLANMDDDRIQNTDTGDSQNAILGAEISYHF